MSIIIVLVIAYILGSLPIGVWVGKTFFRKDIMSSGSGNIGATNAYRTLGPLGGFMVLAGDILKGATPVLIMKSINPPAEQLPFLMVAAGMLAILGHTFSVFLNFKGGKAASTTVGVLAVLLPKVMILIVIIWLILLGITHYVSVSSIITAACLPVLTFLLSKQEAPVLSFSFLVAFLIIYKHRSNIKRLLEGTEPRVKGLKREA